MFDADHREAADAAHVALGRAHRDLLAALVAIDRFAEWGADGARDCAHWVQMRYGISLWKAERWVRAAHELETLPAIADALATGLLSIDKVAELTRFANFDDEDGLVRWARGVPAGAIRHRADVERRRDALEAEVADRARSLTWRHEDDRFEMHAELPTADGEAVRAAIERMVERIPARTATPTPDVPTRSSRSAGRAGAPRASFDPRRSWFTPGSTGSSRARTAARPSKGPPSRRPSSNVSCATHACRPCSRTLAAR
jgi:hypothetical protein